MFDKLIVCEPEGADFKDRRGYFMVSSFVVGVVFLAAVVFSIYAADFGLGNDNFELSMLMAPPEIAATEPEPPRRRMPENQPQSQSQLPSRRDNIARVDEPTLVPTTVSTAANEHLARPRGAFTISTSDTGTGLDSSRNNSDTNVGQPGLSVATKPVEPEPDREPPPATKPVATKPAIVRSDGPINGKATYLPKPPYPAQAIAINLQGKVDVQVMIDETGKVVSANAVSGHAFFRAAAERAAWSAKFSPTYLAKIPVKVTGVIVYNFKK